VAILEAFARVYYQRVQVVLPASPAALAAVFQRRFSDLRWQPLAITDFFDVQPCPYSAGVHSRHPRA
jgi:hypothetical protein